MKLLVIVLKLYQMYKVLWGFHMAKVSYIISQLVALQKLYIIRYCLLSTKSLSLYSDTTTKTIYTKNEHSELTEKIIILINNSTTSLVPDLF